MTPAPTPPGRRGPAVVGLVLAAGAGRRLGTPKGLLREPDGTPWVSRACAALQAGGCGAVSVVVGVRADEVAALVPPGMHVVAAPDWAEGMGASLRAGLTAVATGDPGRDTLAAIVTLVDLPGVGAPVVTRVLERTVMGKSPTRVRASLARAAYRGRPGHPVFLGRDHWAQVLDHAQGDRGARDYLAGRPVELVECADLGFGDDVDTADDLRGR